MFSINEGYKEIELIGTAEDQWPSVVSQEKFHGRKCFEFSWKGGHSHILVGFSLNDYIVNFYSFSPNTRIIIANSTTQVYNDIIGTSIEKDERYMVCIDSYLHKFYFFNGTYAKIVTLPKTKSKEFRAFFQQGVGQGSDTVIGYFSKKYFVHDIPLSFFALSDWRSKEVLTCKNNKHIHNKLMLILLILVS